MGNLIGLLCAEAFLQNVVGLAGFALILWRMWGKTHGELTEWRERRGVGGVLVDISGALAVLCHRPDLRFCQLAPERVAARYKISAASLRRGVDHILGTCLLELGAPPKAPGDTRYGESRIVPGCDIYVAVAYVERAGRVRRRADRARTA